MMQSPQPFRSLTGIAPPPGHPHHVPGHGPPYGGVNSAPRSPAPPSQVVTTTAIPSAAGARAWPKIGAPRAAAPVVTTTTMPTRAPPPQFQPPPGAVVQGAPVTTTTVTTEAVAPSDLQSYFDPDAITKRLAVLQAQKVVEREDKITTMAHYKAFRTNSCAPSTFVGDFEERHGNPAADPSSVARQKRHDVAVKCYRMIRGEIPLQIAASSVGTSLAPSQRPSAFSAHAAAGSAPPTPMEGGSHNTTTTIVVQQQPQPQPQAWPAAPPAPGRVVLAASPHAAVPEQPPLAPQVTHHQPPQGGRPPTWAAVPAQTTVTRLVNGAPPAPAASPHPRGFTSPAAARAPPRSDAASPPPSCAAFSPSGVVVNRPPVAAPGSPSNSLQLSGAVPRPAPPRYADAAGGAPPTYPLVLGGGGRILDGTPRACMVTSSSPRAPPMALAAAPGTVGGQHQQGR